jgi:hypothetical protein
VATTTTSLPGTKSGDTLSALKQGAIPEHRQLQQGSPMLSDLVLDGGTDHTAAPAEAAPQAVQPGVFKPLPDALNTGLKNGPPEPAPTSPAAPSESDAGDQPRLHRMSSATEVANAFGGGGAPGRFRDASEATPPDGKPQRAQPVRS